MSLCGADWEKLILIRINNTDLCGPMCLDRLFHDTSWRPLGLSAQLRRAESEWALGTYFLRYFTPFGSLSHQKDGISRESSQGDSLWNEREGEWFSKHYEQVSAQRMLCDGNGSWGNHARCSGALFCITYSGAAWQKRVFQIENSVISG